MASETDLEEIYAETWGTRERKLAGMTYGEYLESDHWQNVKAKAKSRPNYQKCEFCTSTKTELHHTSYKWLRTNNELRVIISLCSTSSTLPERKSLISLEMRSKA